MAKRVYPPVKKSLPYATITVELFPEFRERLASRPLNRFQKGLSSNLTTYAYLTFLFEINEYLPKHQKLTDFQIAKAALNEFPGNKAMQKLVDAQAGRIRKKGRASVQNMRLLYNLGKLRPQDGPRKGPISFRYDAKGDRLSNYGNKDKPLTPKEEAAILARYGPDTRREQEFNYHVQINHPVVKPIGRPSYESFDWCI